MGRFFAAGVGNLGQRIAARRKKHRFVGSELVEFGTDAMLQFTGAGLTVAHGPTAAARQG